MQEVLLTKEEIQAKVRELAERISEKYKNQKVIVIGVLKGAWIFMADLVRELEIEMACDFVRVSSYRSGTEAEEIELLYWPDFDIKGQKVLIVDDIADTGLTLKFLEKKFKEKGAASVEFCVLLDKPARRKVEFEPQFVGFTIPDRFVIGYGMDYKERYRNLPCIRVLEKED